ncbi:MAG: DUF3293 domain-containing protein [Acidimicrobiales bacterium]|jgi:hypothetical protein
MATEQDWDSYRVAVVDVAPPGRHPFRIVPAAAGVHGRWPRRSQSAVHVLTAWNPDSIRLDRDVNDARNARLLADLDAAGLTYWPAIGRDLVGDHFEEGVAVLGLGDREAVAMGRNHGQAAVYRWTPDVWQVISCTDDRRETSGWRTVPVPAEPD